MKLKSLAKRMKPAPVPSDEVEYHAILNKAATAITGAAPGDPAHEAIVNPRRGRPAKGESRTSVLTAVRLPAAVVAAARQSAHLLMPDISAASVARAACPCSHNQPRASFTYFSFMCLFADKSGQ
jgi:hypothetical protein